MKQCQEKLLQQKNSIIQKLQSTKISISDRIKTDPRLWDEEYFQFDLSSVVDLRLKAEIFVQDLREIEESSEEEFSSEDIWSCDKIQIFVKIYGRVTRTIVLFAELSDTVKNLKDMIQKREGIPPNKQKLNNYRCQLRDELTLSDYNINNNTTLSLSW